MASSLETQNKNRELKEESFSYAFQIMNSSVLSMSMHTAIQLDLFEIIAKAGPDAKLSPNEIAAQLSSKNPEAPSMLDRILRLLASHGIVACSMADDEDEEGNARRLYGLTNVSKFFVRNEDGVSLAPMMSLLQHKVLIDSWQKLVRTVENALKALQIRGRDYRLQASIYGRSQLKESIIEGGIPFNRVHGMNAFEYPNKDPKFNQDFNIAMKNNATLVMKNILGVYQGFVRHLDQVVVDVGGCLGVSLRFITSKYPSIKGINFDLPHVIQNAPPIPGVEHVAGDMFQNVPKADAIFMKSVLHDWSDDHCVKILKNCYDAIPNDGKVIVVDSVLPIVPEMNAYSRGLSQMDVSMMTTNPGGKERTKQEYEALVTRAGFSGINFVCFVCNFWVMEFFK